jgi:hypothetical protein
VLIERRQVVQAAWDRVRNFARQRPRQMAGRIGTMRLLWHMFHGHSAALIREEIRKRRNEVLTSAYIETAKTALRRQMRALLQDLELNLDEPQAELVGGVSVWPEPDHGEPEADGHAAAGDNTTERDEMGLEGTTPPAQQPLDDQPRRH